MSTQAQITTDEEAKKNALSASQQQEIEQAFREARDFRSIWEKITAPLDSIISDTARVIDTDPIMTVSWSLEEMNKEVQWVYKDIINNDWAVMKFVKSIPVLWSLAKTLDGKIDEAQFNMKWVEGKIEMIFSWFDTSYNSINTSIDLQKKFLDWIDDNLWKVVAYKDYVWEKIVEFKAKMDVTTDEETKHKMSLFIRNVEFFQTNLVVLIWNLEMAKKRLLMRLDSANKLSLAMNSSKPIFKTLLSTAIIESSSQKAIDASMKAMEVMGQTIDKMSSDLTDKAIDSSKKAEEMSSKPVVSTSVFVENVTKLKNHFDQVEESRKAILADAMEEKKLFEEAGKKLESIKLLNKKDTEELNNLLES